MRPLRTPALLCLLLLMPLERLGAGDASKHPLDPVIREYHAMQRHIADEIRDYACTLTKIERLNGELREPEELQVKVRLPKMRDGAVVQKFSIFLSYVAPPKLTGRKVLFVEGENDGKMFIKVGGLAPDFVRMKDYPDSPRALRASRYPVTHLGFQQVITTLLDRAARSQAADPDGVRTEVSITRDSLVQDRSCMRIRVMRAVRKADLHHIDEIYIDDEWRVPTQLVAYDWPESEGDEPVLLESYTYSDVKLNVGLDDSDFARSVVE